MDDKKSTKAECNKPPTLPPVKRALRSTSAAVMLAMPAATAAPVEQNQPSKELLMKAMRAMLDKEGLLKQEECITVGSLYDTFKLIHDRYNAKIPSDVQKTMLTFKVLLGMLTAQQQQEQDIGMTECAVLISKKVEEAIGKGLAKLSGIMESTLANQKDMQNSLKHIEGAAQAIHKALEEVDKNLAVVSDSSNKLTNTVSSYKDALLTVPRPPQLAQTNRPMDQNNPRIIRDQHRKVCQVLVDIYNKDTVNRSLEELKNNFNTLIGQEPTEPLADVNVQHIIKLRNGGLILQFETKEAAEWFKQPVILSSILPQIGAHVAQTVVMLVRISCKKAVRVGKAHVDP